jgi:hypothetical protein
MSAPSTHAQPDPDRLFAVAPFAQGPRGARVGDLVLVERSWWRVLSIDHTRREAVCRLVDGSRAVRRFGARRIDRVSRGGWA